VVGEGGTKDRKGKDEEKNAEDALVSVLSVCD
jgi:hypothetical protein